MQKKSWGRRRRIRKGKRYLDVTIAVIGQFARENENVPGRRATPTKERQCVQARRKKEEFYWYKQWKIVRAKGARGGGALGQRVPGVSGKSGGGGSKLANFRDNREKKNTFGGAKEDTEEGGGNVVLESKACCG